MRASNGRFGPVRRSIDSDGSPFRSATGVTSLRTATGVASRPADTVFSPVTDPPSVSEPTAHHVGITVSDLDRAVGFYTEVFGLDVVSEFSVGGEAFADAVDVASASASFAHLGADGVRVELVAYAPEGEPMPERSLDRPGATHLGLAVDDVAAFHDDLPEDVETLSEPRTTESGTTVLFIRDPEGNLIEVLDA